MKKVLLALTAGALLTLPLSADDKKVDPTVKYRHHAMETVKDALIQMKEIVSGKGNAADFATHARVMAANAEGFYLAAKAKVPGGDSKQAVWDDWADFSQRMEKFIADANAMAALPGGADLKEKAAAFGKTTKSCKSCHDKYRKD